MLNLTTIASELSDSESLTESCPTRPSLAISEHSLIQDLPSFIAGLLTLSQAVSPASRFPSQGNEQEQTTNETCGQQHGIASAWLDPATASLKTFQASLIADISEPSLATWPKAGIVCDGEFFPQPSWERRISEIAFGLWLTPTATVIGERSQEALEKRQAYRASIGRNTTPPGNLAEQVRYGAPTVNMWRTPSATVVEPKKSVVKLTGRTPQDPQVGLADQVGGQLNPTWVEWLMGWPIGWADLKPLETANVQRWLEQHGIC